MADPQSPVDVQDLTVDIAGRLVLDRLSFSCAAGEWLVLVGPSGCGKTTLLRVINGLQMPTRGIVWTLGTPIPGRSTRQARAVWRQTGTVQQGIALFDTRSVSGNVELGLRAAGSSLSAARGAAGEWLQRLGLHGRGKERPFRLSGGQRQRVALARALAMRPRLLLLDEPTSALDQASARVVLEAVRDLTRCGTAVVMSSHRVEEVRSLCDRILDLGAHGAPPATVTPRPREADLEGAPPST